MFGGEKSGHIALLFSSGNLVSMPYACPAHDGHVTKLFASRDVIRPFSDDPDSSAATQTALVSYGTDNMLNIWCLRVKASNQIFLKLLMSIHTELEPVLGRLLGSIICLSFLDNRIVMLNTLQRCRPDSRIIATSHSLSRMSLLTHQAEDDHTGSVISLECCPSMGIFATSSKDGHIKIWNKDNHLVSEIDFGKSLASVCFANLQGDLLVGFQKHISLIKAKDYLPDTILEMRQSSPHTDCVEQPLTFDYDLEFWYDSERTPCLPAEQDGRKVYRRNLNSGHHVTITSEDDLKGSIMVGPSETEMKASAQSLQSKVDSCLARELSQQYAASIFATQSKLKLKQIHHHKAQDSGKHQKLFSDATTTNDSEKFHGEEDTQEVPPVASLPTVIVNSSSNGCPIDNGNCGYFGFVGSRRTSGSMLTEQESLVSDVYFPKAEVLRLQHPSSKFPIAPDCKFSCYPNVVRV